MKKFYVFTLASREVREGTRLIGWRDHRNFDTLEEAEQRRAELKISPELPIQKSSKRRIIRMEKW